MRKLRWYYGVQAAGNRGRRCRRYEGLLVVFISFAGIFDNEVKFKSCFSTVVKLFHLLQHQGIGPWAPLRSA